MTRVLGVADRKVLHELASALVGGDAARVPGGRRAPRAAGVRPAARRRGTCCTTCATWSSRRSAPARRAAVAARRPGPRCASCSIWPTRRSARSSSSRRGRGRRPFAPLPGVLARVRRRRAERPAANGARDGAGAPGAPAAAPSARRASRSRRRPRAAPRGRPPPGPAPRGRRRRRRRPRCPGDSRVDPPADRWRSNPRLAGPRGPPARRRRARAAGVARAPTAPPDGAAGRSPALRRDAAPGDPAPGDAAPDDPAPGGESRYGRLARGHRAAARGPGPGGLLLRARPAARDLVVARHRGLRSERGFPG